MSHSKGWRAVMPLTCCVGYRFEGVCLTKGGTHCFVNMMTVAGKHLWPLQGVGSHAAHLLLRSGVGRLRLIDFDQVTLSSLNRHCLATRADVGTPKATCLAQHFKTILSEVG